MKKLLIIFAVMALAVPAFADNPIMKGNFVISLPMLLWERDSGDRYEVAGEDKDIMALSFGVYEAGVQYFIIDGLAIGGSLGYRTEEQGDVTSTRTLIAPKVSYFLNMGSILPYASVAWEMTKTEVKNGVTTEDTDTRIPVAVGIAFPLGKHLALFGEVFYSMDEREPDMGDAVEGTALGVSLGFKGFF